jgi:hypothetical protein
LPEVLPKQTSAQILGRQGERWFHSILPPEWVFTRPSEDFGIDGTVAIGDSAAMTPVEFGVQIKASSHWATQGENIVVTGIAVETLRYCSPAGSRLQWKLIVIPRG